MSERTCLKPHWGYGPITYNAGSPCPLCGAYRAGVAAEREACAKVVEHHIPLGRARIGFMAETEQLVWKLELAAEEIRCRGDKVTTPSDE
jgi:hypothetical protein